MPTLRQPQTGISTNVQLTFSGVNAQAPAHMLPEGDVQSATDVDFSLERGCISVRRGVVQQISTLFQHYTLFKSYAPSIASSVIYSGYKNAGTYGVGFGTIGGAFTTIINGGFNAQNVGFAKHKDFTFIAGAGTSTASYAYARHDGSSGSATQWILPAPGAPTITLATQGTFAIGTGSYALLEGTLTGTATATVTADSTSGRIALTVAGVGTVNLTTNAGGFTIGNFGIHYVDLMYSNPQNVYRISYDFSVGDTTFVNYFHGELQPNTGLGALSGLPDPSALVSAQLYQGTDTTSGITAAQKAAIASVINQNFVPVASDFPTAPNVFGALAIPRTNFSFVGALDNTAGTDPWSNIQAVRIVVENFTNSPLQIIQLRNPRIAGDSSHPLNDMNAGYTWWNTYGVADSEGNIVEESAPSPPSTIQLGQHCNATVVSNLGTANLNSPRPSGVTHIITYRQGGYTQDAYAVNTQAYNTPYTPTTTFTDTMNDIQAISLNIPMTRDVYQISPGTNVDFPGDVTVLAPQSWYDRLFIADRNQLLWSMPGKPGTFPHTSIAQMSHIGDQIAAIIPYSDTLIIVNRDSVYEMRGSIFEGPNTDFVLQRSGARHGSIAQASVVQTPHGIPLLHYDGLEMYVPGQGVSQSVPWVTEQMGDAFRGFGAGDPAALKGSRVPAINGNINLAAAAYYENKLYIAAATGTSTVNNTIFVLDFATQKVWWYNPGFITNPYNLYWDFLNNSLIAAGFSGVFQLENSTSDGGGAITSSFRTRAWSVPQDTLVENIAMEFAGGPWTLTAIYDGTSTQTVGTFGTSGQPKSWTIPTLGGTLTNNVVFGVSGTTTGLASVYQISFDAIRQPARVSYFKTDYDTNNYPGEKLWTDFTIDMGILGTNPLGGSSANGTVNITAYIDNNPVGTFTAISTSAAGGGRNQYTYSLPAESFGQTAFAVMTNTTTGTGVGNTFKLWDFQWIARNEPLRTTYFKTDPISGDEVILDGFTVDIYVQGTVTATVFADSVALTTQTLTNTTTTGNPQHRQSYVRSVPVESYARSYWIEYTSTNQFKHYATKFHTRPEANRYTTFVSPRQTFPSEMRFQSFATELNCLGNSVVASIYVDGNLLQLSTFTGSLRDRYVVSFPPEVYGKTAWASYITVGSSDIPGGISPSTGGTVGAVPGVFKWYENEHFDGTREPDRLGSVQVILPPYPSGHQLKTWIVQMNPLGTATGTFMADGFVIATNSFVGNIRESFVTGIDENISLALQTATALECRYNAGPGGTLKHYSSAVESSPVPFSKLTWAFAYRKLGGASQIDLLRFLAFDVESSALSTMTYTVDLDEQPNWYTGTLVVSGRQWFDRIPVPGGGRARLFQIRCNATAPIKVWRSSLTMEHVGIKGFAATTVDSTPVESSYEAFKFSQ